MPAVISARLLWRVHPDRGCGCSDATAAYVVAAVDDETTAYQDWLDLDADHRGWLVRGDEREPVARAPASWSDFYPAVVAMVARRRAAAGRPQRRHRGARGARRGPAIGPRSCRGQSGMTGSNSSGSVLRGISHSTPTSTTAEATTPRNTLCDASNNAEREWAARSPSVALAIAPNTATPTALPRERQNMLVPVTTPRRCQPTTDCTATMVGPRRDRARAPTTKHGPGHREHRGARRQQRDEHRADDHDHAADQGGVAEPDPQVDPAGERRRDRPADGQRGQREAGHQRPGAEHALDVRRHVGA